MTSVDEAVLHVGRQLGAEPAASQRSAPVPAGDAERVRALQASGVLGEHLRPRFEAAAQRAAEIFDMPLALVSMIDADVQHLCAAGGALSAAVRQGGEQRPRAQALCAHVVASADKLVVEDVARDPRFGDNPMLGEHGLRFYAGVPLRGEGGAVYGSFALLDSEPRVLSPRELRLLEAMGKDLMDSVLDQGEAAAPSTPPAPGAGRR